jgi:hypothetical protein
MYFYHSLFTPDFYLRITGNFKSKGKGKGTVHPRTDHEGPEGEWRYSSTLLFNLGDRWRGWSTSRPGCFTPRKKIRHPLYSRLGGPRGLSGRVRKISPPPVFEPRTDQPVASCYTDWPIPALTVVLKLNKFELLWIYCLRKLSNTDLYLKNSVRIT